MVAMVSLMFIIFHHLTKEVYQPLTATARNSSGIGLVKNPVLMAAGEFAWEWAGRQCGVGVLSNKAKNAGSGDPAYRISLEIADSGGPVASPGGAGWDLRRSGGFGGFHPRRNRMRCGWSDGHSRAPVELGRCGDAPGSSPVLTFAGNCCILTTSGGGVSETPASRRRVMTSRGSLTCEVMKDL